VIGHEGHNSVTHRKGVTQSEGVFDSFPPGHDDLTPEAVVSGRGAEDAPLMLLARFTLESACASDAVDLVRTAKDLWRLGAAVSLDGLEPRARVELYRWSAGLSAAVVGVPTEANPQLRRATLA